MAEAPLKPDHARQLLMDSATCVVPSDACALAAADGRIMATDLIATANLPASANAAVDGYAIDASILATNASHSFPVIGRAAAGHPFDGVVPSGAAIRIFTGAVMPVGTNAVAMQEDCTATNDHVQINIPLKIDANHRPAGENIRDGEIIIPAGKRLGPADLGIAAAAGHATLEIRRQLRVGLLSMGDEIIDPGDALARGQSYDSNRPMLASLLRADGFAVQDYGIIPDDEAALTTAYRQAMQDCDVVVSSGGASDGDEDHTQGAIRAVGASLVFWRLAMKPGRPMAVGAAGNQRIFCLPGNPVAAFVCYRLLTAPVLARMAGATPPPVLRPMVRSGFDHKKKPGRAEYLRVRIATDSDGQPNMILHGRRGAGVLSSLTGADGLVEIPVDNAGVSAGDYLSFIPFREAAL